MALALPINGSVVRLPQSRGWVEEASPSRSVPDVVAFHATKTLRGIEGMTSEGQPPRQSAGPLWRRPSETSGA